MNIIMCITGSVAAVESVKLARELKRQGFDIKCFMSDSACQIIHPYSMEFATGEKVVLEITGAIEHVKYASADLILVAPATANVISKFAFKISDNPINSLLITAFGQKTPIIMVPSMHDAMYQAVEENIEKLENEGIQFIAPRIEESKAKFPHMEDIVLKVLRETSAGDLKGKKVLISAGGTYEAIDPVRGISNRSSGKMGLELAKEAYIRGAEVMLLAGEMKVNIPPVIPTICTSSTGEMATQIQDLIIDYDIFISAAAVADFTPTNFEENKISSSKNLLLNLKPTPKIIEKAKIINPDIFLVGFKAEYGVSREELIESSLLQLKTTDIVVANDVSIDGAGFGSDFNQVLIIDKENVEENPLLTKKEISKIIFNKILTKLK
ncbi:bifunctional phosphopantothenoylcysteine decarboxylase/phosphopantothenate--cysteine ligase CoaBC [Methanobacterium alkalithermotolerans]|uniref:Coenzyme A biosynthesis bifunctional protein CoaBC n=2 Tax=Methanobacterium alkalithermotolerans TaxID=2731220 RepID=A0A8T8KB42_9EURY|nr:bifunctional phosphopantothenoylcysteine decarboxylase/phosphopantothenate--cysteine ligase CoaBC [Methanobacterium alkalithermotolerans]RJS49262.1 MAG: bifunctional phosphopantothenoylcysteine decarboxylase/phosphopantothenate--cysteine ligase CoaBC [Methanobacterium sp.]